MKYFNLIMGLLYFLAFANDMEHVRTGWTWFFGIISFLNLMFFFSEYIVDLVVKKMKEED